MSSHVLKTTRDGDSATCLGSLIQCLTTLSVKKFFLMSNLNLLRDSVRPFPVVQSLVTREKRLTPTWPQPPIREFWRDNSASKNISYLYLESCCLCGSFPKSNDDTFSSLIPMVFCKHHANSLSGVAVSSSLKLSTEDNKSLMIFSGIVPKGKQNDFKSAILSPKMEQHQAKHKMGEEWLKSSPKERDLGVLAGSRINRQGVWLGSPCLSMSASCHLSLEKCCNEKADVINGHLEEVDEVP
ncbi:hypothetical protein BTVI_39803 [Pitangus sulphuratus]|nr:hypothetical protein BTVI_39803 [Pitangus sulphuratus]